jgi:NAD(P)-dependent dehydrogenase (short-subunit alcohol dehydrogenase family)
MSESAFQGYVLILGASSGFGASSAVEFARAGYDVFGVHLDRKATMAEAERVLEAVRATGREVAFFNVNAADPEKRGEVLDFVERRLKETGRPGAVKVLLHSLAFGTLKPLSPAEGGDGITQAQLEMTLDVMANSLVYWVQEVVRRKLMGPGGRIFAMTSEGSNLAWPNYGPVSAAKSALESYCRQLAVELAPQDITSNAIRAGVTDTPALRKIPGHDQMIAVAKQRNPHKRLTTPEDVARCLLALARPETAWLTGNVLGVDGGEHVSG